MGDGWDHAYNRETLEKYTRIGDGIIGATCVGSGNMRRWDDGTTEVEKLFTYPTDEIPYSVSSTYVSG